MKALARDFDGTLYFEDGIKETIDWYLNNQEWIEDIKSGKYKDAYQK